MTLPGAALAASIDAQWNVGTGGTKPAPIEYIVSISDRDINPTDEDAIYVYLPLGGTKKKFNNSLRNAWYFPRVVCHTKTSAARQEEIMNEVDRIVSSGTVITGATRQQVLEINDISDRAHGGFAKYITELQVEIFTQMEASATSYGTATTATLETDELTVNDFITGLGVTVTDFLDEDDMASDSAVALATQQSIKAYVDTHNNIGSVNAKWFPMTFMIEIPVGKLDAGGGWAVSNVNGTDVDWFYNLTIPKLKGSLKLYVNGMQLILHDADVNNYIDRIRVQGVVYNNNTSIVDEGTNRTTPNKYPTLFAAVDCSSFDEIIAFVEAQVLNAHALDVRGVQLRCYYDT